MDLCRKKIVTIMLTLPGVVDCPGEQRGQVPGDGPRGPQHGAKADSDAGFGMVPYD